MFTLRPYQEEAVQAGMKALMGKSTKPGIILMATGAGKSLVIAEICHRLNEPTLILCPSREILVQNYDKLKSYGIDDIGLYSASVNQKDIKKYTYATIQSVYKKPEEFKHFKYIIVDECHQLDPQNGEGMLTSFVKAINCQGVIGLTATPYRIVQKYYTDEIGQKWYTAHLRMINRIWGR